MYSFLVANKLFLDNAFIQRLKALAFYYQIVNHKIYVISRKDLNAGSIAVQGMHAIQNSHKIGIKIPIQLYFYKHL